MYTNKYKVQITFKIGKYNYCSEINQNKIKESIKSKILNLTVVFHLKFKIKKNYPGWYNFWFSNIITIFNWLLITSIENRAMHGFLTIDIYKFRFINKG